MPAADLKSAPLTTRANWRGCRAQKLAYKSFSSNQHNCDHTGFDSLSLVVFQGGHWHGGGDAQGSTHCLWLLSRAGICMRGVTTQGSTHCLWLCSRVGIGMRGFPEEKLRPSTQGGPREGHREEEARLNSAKICPSPEVWLCSAEAVGLRSHAVQTLW